MSVSRHWRITFRIEQSDGFNIYDVQEDEYH